MKIVPQGSVETSLHLTLTLLPITVTDMTTVGRQLSITFTSL